MLLEGVGVEMVFQRDYGEKKRAVHLFIEQICIESFLCWEVGNEQNRQKFVSKD